jgi:hypothetical protein
MTYCALSNQARILKRSSSRFAVIISITFSLIVWISLESSGATIAYLSLLNSLTKGREVLKMRNVYNATPVIPSKKKLIIEIQDTGPELPYIYIQAGFEDEWIKSIGKKEYKKNNRTCKNQRNITLCKFTYSEV